MSEYLDKLHLFRQGLIDKVDNQLSILSISINNYNITKNKTNF